MLGKTFNLDLNLFFPQSPRLLGIDISSSSVKIIELSKIKKKSTNTYRLERYVIEPMSKEAIIDGNIQNLEAVGESIRKGVEKNRFTP